MSENTLDDVRPEDGGDDLCLYPATGTGLHIDLEDPLQEPGPGHSSPSGRLSLRRGFRIALGHDSAPYLRVRGETPVIPDQVDSGNGNECRQLFQKFFGREEQIFGPVVERLAPLLRRRLPPPAYGNGG